MKYLIALFLFMFTGALKAQELKVEQLQFAFISTDGQIYADCAVTKGGDTHDFDVSCPDVKRNFTVHTLLNTYQHSDPSNSTLIEFLYWVDEPDNNFKSNTQTTWITVNQISNVTKIVSYVGLDDDTSQLRVEVSL